MSTKRISWNPSFVAFMLGSVAFSLVILSTAAFIMWSGDVRYHWLVRLSYVDCEQNIPTLFSSFLLFFAFLLLVFIAVVNRNRRTSSAIYWAVLSFGFLFMAVDEQFSFHEQLSLPMQNLLGGGHYGFLYFAWVIPGIAMVFILGLFFFRFWWRLPVKTRLTFLMAAVLYLGGCIGFELVGGYYAESNGFLDLTYCMIVTIEESLEMAGAIIFIRGLMTYIEDNYKAELFFLIALVKRQSQTLWRRIHRGLFY